MENGLSASDVALMAKDGGFGDSFVWIFGLLILIGLFNGGWGGNNASTNTLDQDIQRGFDNQNLQAQTRDILSAVTAGTAQSVAATNQTFHDTLMANQNLYNEITRDIAGLGVGQAQLLANQNECCCTTKQLIMQNNYDAAMRDAATNANISAQIQSVKDMMAQDKIEALTAKVNELQLEQATANVIRYPNAWTFPATNPFCTCPTTSSTTTTG